MGLNLQLRLAAAVRALSTDPVAHAGSDYWPQFLTEADGLRAIDDLVLRKGLVAYREMPQRDEQIASCDGFVTYARLASHWSVGAASGDEIDKKVAAAWEDNCSRLRKGSMTRLLQNAMGAISMGFSIQEKIWDDPAAPSKFPGLQYYREFRDIPQESITFKLDQFGQIEPDGVWQSKPHLMQQLYTAPQMYNHLQADRFVIWSWQQQWGNPLGRSVLRPAYRWFVWKDMMVRWWAQHMEHHGRPWVIGEYDDNTNADQRKEMKSKLAAFLSNRIMLLKRGQKIDIKDPSASAQANFDIAIQRADRAIARCYYVPALLTETASTGSSRAASKTHQNVFEYPLKHLGWTLRDEVVKEAVLRPWVDHNFGPNVDLPKWDWEEYSQPDRVAIATIFKILADLGVPLSVQRIREALGEPDPGPDDLLVGGAQDNPAQGVDPNLIDQAKGIDGLLADLVKSSGDPSGNDLIDVLRGNGKASGAMMKDQVGT